MSEEERIKLLSKCKDIDCICQDCMWLEKIEPIINQLQQENQSLKKQLDGIREERDYLFNKLSTENKNLTVENKKIKKQLEEYKYSHSCSFADTCKNVKIADYNQQKEFIEYLEEEMKKNINWYNSLTPHDKNYYYKDYVDKDTNYMVVLSKYKEIIGVPMAGLDDEEEPDLFEMIEDMKNKFKHIEEINKSYPIFNFDKKSFEAMKDMLQDVYSKQVEIIKSVNYLFDKDERQHRKNNESPAELN